MKLRYITCSDPREDIPVESLLNFTEKYPIAEIGVQAHPGPMSFDRARNKWFGEIIKKAQNMPTPPNIALHINYHWCDHMCEGFIPNELDWWLRVPNAYTGQPVVKRIQLNIGDYTNKFDVKKLNELMNQHKKQEFIFPWNNRVANKIETLKQEEKIAKIRDKQITETPIQELNQFLDVINKSEEQLEDYAYKNDIL